MRICTGYARLQHRLHAEFDWTTQKGVWVPVRDDAGVLAYRIICSGPFMTPHHDPM